MQMYSPGQQTGSIFRFMDCPFDYMYGIQVRIFNSICWCLVQVFGLLKVPKHENFSLAFFALSEPIWVCDLGTGEKNRIFYQLTPDFDGFRFFAAYWMWGKPKKNLKLSQNQKLAVVAFEPISMPTMCFLENFEVLVLLWMFKKSKKNKFF